MRNAKTPSRSPGEGASREIMLVDHRIGESKGEHPGRAAEIPQGG
jgi:hypothetical protein